MENGICPLIVRLSGHLFKLIPLPCLSFAESVAPQHLDVARNALWMDASRSPLIRWCDVKAIILNFTPGIHNEAVKRDRKASRSAQGPDIAQDVFLFLWTEMEWEEPFKWSSSSRMTDVCGFASFKVWETRNAQLSLIVHKGGCHIGLRTQGCRGSSEFFRHEIPTSQGAFLMT